MIIYFDTSALVKKYFNENYSSEVIDLWINSTAIITSAITYAETVASFCRKKRDVQIENKIFQGIIKTFTNDWDSFIRFNVNDDLNIMIENLSKKYFLRGFDAIHLATALIAKEKIQDDYVFACFDRSLLKAARNENMTTFPEMD